MWKETRMGRWDGEHSYLPYLLANRTDTKGNDSDTKGTATDPSLDTSDKLLESGAKAKTSACKTSGSESYHNFSASDESPAEENPNTYTNLQEFIPTPQPDCFDF